MGRPNVVVAMRAAEAEQLRSIARRAQRAARTDRPDVGARLTRTAANLR
jgi:hypothetical protein